jgi:protein phosphatase 1L
LKTYAQYLIVRIAYKNLNNLSHVPRINGELAVTRSFGDKKHSEYGLIAVPEITHKVLTPNHKLLLIGTDGFWNVKVNI